jgi:hypothetical protein
MVPSLRARIKTDRRSLLDLVCLSGFDQPETLIHLFIGGSELHGAKVGLNELITQAHLDFWKHR